MDHDKKQIEKELFDLRNTIRKHDHNYYILDNPLISDEEYDYLFAKLKALETQYPDLITSDSPTMRIGANPISHQLPTVKHRYPMLSLDNAFNYEEANLFHQRLEKILNEKEWSKHNPLTFMCEPKIDGIAVNLVYENGILTHATTRGNGIIGEDITANIRTIKQIPLTLLDKRYLQRLDVRGEVYMSKHAFQQLNAQFKKQNKKLFANPRNAAAGSLRQLNCSITAQRKLNFFGYGLYTQNNETLPPTQFEILKLLTSLGFKTNQYSQLAYSMDECEQYFEKMIHQRDDLPYEIDGIVYKVNDLHLQQLFGHSPRAPKWAIARKFTAKQAQTQLLAVDFQVGRTGLLTPVARLTPVKLGGVTISNATLHSMNEIQRLNLCINDMVLIKRSGDVIPKIIERLAPDHPTAVNRIPIQLPKKCPQCSAPIEHCDGEATARCTGSLHCPAQIKATIIHFASKEAMNIEHVGPKLIEQLLDQRFIHSPADLYKLTKEQLLTLPKIKEKSVNNILNSLEKSKQTTFSKFLFALGIHQVGSITAQLLAKTFEYDLNLLKNTCFEQLEKLKDIGPITATHIVNFFQDPYNLSIIEQLEASGVRWNKEIPQQLKLSTQNWVITGTLNNYTRTQAKQWLEQQGAKVSNTLSKTTSHLLVGKDPGKKLALAQKLGITIIDEQQWLKDYQ